MKVRRSAPTHPSLCGGRSLRYLLLAVSLALPIEAVAQDAAAPAVDSALYQELRYRMIGPHRGGRVTTVAGIAGQPHTFYMGSTGGGVWKTTDAGHSWVNVSDGYFEAASMGDIDVADSNADVVFAGTGSDGLRSNVSTGRGVYKSTDGAKTWTFVGLRDAGQIGAVEIHPSNPDIVYVAAIGNAFAPNPERGLFRTTDGGRSWKKILFISDSTGIVDVVLDPSASRTVYAAAWRTERKPWTIISGGREGGIYKSTDGGDSWTRLTRGLPGGLIGKIDLSISPAAPKRIWALIEAPGDSGGLYRSEDGGASFALINAQPSLLNRPFYYTGVTADPVDPDLVYVNNETFWKSTDGGRNFKRLSTPHGDNHDMWINPRDPRNFVQSNDGGANVTLDGGRSWSTQYNQPTAELYQVAVDDQFPYRVYGAQQDNSTLMVPSRPVMASRPDDPMQHWRAAAGCETGPVVPHPKNPEIIYGGCKGRFSRLSLSTGQEKNYWVGAQNMYGHDPKDLKLRFQRVSPIAVSPHDPRVIYHASQFVHRTTDEGVTWTTISPDLTANDPSTQGISGGPITRDITGEEFYSTIYAFAESALEKGVLWAGANDGPIHISRDNGRRWTEITPRDLPPGGRVQTIELSPHRKGSAYVAVLRYLLGDFRPYIYRTDDYGRSWTLLTDGRNGIPADHPTRVVREDPGREGLLYAGTEFGMFVSFDNGARWQPLQLNLPATPVTDLAVHRKDLVLSTQGRSFWILDDLSPLHQLTPQLASARAHLFAPRAAHRIRHPRSGDDPGEPQYPEPGATIDYLLGGDVAEVRLDILDRQGAVIRSFSSADPADTTERITDSMRRPTVEGIGTPRLPTGRGMHRVLWNLRHPGPWDANRERSGRDGPLAVPGRYSARLTVTGANGDGAWTETRPLIVQIDPRVARDGVTQADLEEQLTLALRVRDAISEAKMAAARIDTLRGSLAERSGEREQLEAIRRRLVTEDGKYPQPMLISQLGYLYGMITDADQKSGRDAHQRFRELRQALDRELAAMREAAGAERAAGR